MQFYLYEYTIKEIVSCKLKSSLDSKIMKIEIIFSIEPTRKKIIEYIKYNKEWVLYYCDFYMPIEQEIYKNIINYLNQQILFDPLVRLRTILK